MPILSIFRQKQKEIIIHSITCGSVKVIRQKWMDDDNSWNSTVKELKDKFDRDTIYFNKESERRKLESKAEKFKYEPVATLIEKMTIVEQETLNGTLGWYQEGKLYYIALDHRILHSTYNRIQAEQVWQECFDRYSGYKPESKAKKVTYGSMNHALKLSQTIDDNVWIVTINGRPYGPSGNYDSCLVEFNNFRDQMSECGVAENKY